MKCEKCGNYVSDEVCEKCGTPIDVKNIVFTKNNNREFYTLKMFGLFLLLLSTFFPYISIADVGNFSLLVLWQNIGSIGNSLALDGIAELSFIPIVSVLCGVALFINIGLILYTINGSARKIDSDTTPITCIWTIALSVILFILIICINNQIKPYLITDFNEYYNIVSLTVVPYIQVLLSAFVCSMDLKLE